ncbi:hypothetical protein I3843_05G168200 [Carya illinoinensis]|nr:hypothetical protein I3843_05G168200 [Carya illinoinensis]
MGRLQYWIGSIVVWILGGGFVPPPSHHPVQHHIFTKKVQTKTNKLIDQTKQTFILEK